MKDQATMTQNDGLIVVWMNVAERYDEELHAWYETEHVPEIASLPGINSVRRCIDPAHPLRYMAMFECSDDKVESDPAFRHMIAHATPWTSRVRNLFGEQRRRGNYRKIDDHHVNSTNTTATTAWLVVQSNTAPQDLASACAAMAGCTRYRAFVQRPPNEVFRPELAYLHIYDFASLERAEAAKQTCSAMADISVSLRRAVGTPAITSADDASRHQETWEAKQIARRMTNGFNVPYTAAVEPAVQFIVAVTEQHHA